MSDITVESERGLLRNADFSPASNPLVAEKRPLICIDEPS
jgi:hypothetical protein